MRRAFTLTLAAVCAAALAETLQAQTVGAGANLGFYNLNGDPFEEIEGGFGYEAYVQLSPGGGGGGGPPIGGAGAPGLGFGGGGFSLGVGIKRTFHDVQPSGEVDTRSLFVSPGLDLSPASSRVRLSVRTRLSPFARIDFGEDAEGQRIRSDGFEVGGAVGSEIFLLKWLAIEPSVYGSYLNLEEPGPETADETEEPPALPGFDFALGERISGWSLGFRLGLNLLVR